MTTVAPRAVSRSFDASERRRTAWGWPQYLAIVGVVYLVWELWTLVAWVTDHPYFITQYRDTRGADWWTARVAEALAISGFVAVAIWVVRRCIRERRLTFDAMFCIAGLSTWWGNESLNSVLPVFSFSSNWTSVNSPCGHMPFVINPDCGRTAHPVLLFLPFWTGILLGMAVFAGWLVGRIRRRWPDISKGRLILLVMFIGIGFDFVMELPLIGLGLWTYFSPDHLSVVINGGGANRYALAEIIAGGVWWSLMCMVRIFKDDKGLTVVERGLSHLSNRKRKAVSQFALIGLFNLLNWTVGTIPLVAYGPYMDPIKALPSHLSNGICDTPGVTGTRYGPCPGSPGFRMPMRSLPGPRP